MILAHCRNTLNPSLFPQGAGAMRLWDGGTRMALLNPARGQFVWDRLDAHLAASELVGLKSIYVFGSTPAWAAIPTSGQAGIIDATSNRPMDPQALSDFVDALMARYGNRLWALETWNEWNAPAFFCGTVAQLAVQQYIIYTRAKAQNSNILVTTPTPCYAPKCLYPTVDVAMAAFLPLQMPFDVVTFHGYIAAGTAAGTIGATIDALRAVSPAGKPLWDTEFGPGSPTNFTPDAARLWIFDALIARRKKNLDLACYYQWDNPTHGACVDPTGALTAFGQAMLDAAVMG